MLDSTEILKGITIVDISHRLPGPLACYLLECMGAKVIKIEDERFKDPFIEGLFADFDPSFKLWYKGLNQNKEIVRFSFKDPNAKKITRDILEKADAVLVGVPPKLQERLGVTSLEMENFSKPLAAIYMGASKENPALSLHDINAFSLSGLMEFFLKGQTQKRIDPPLFPYSGIGYGQKMATELLGLLVKAKLGQKPELATTYILEATKEIFTPFWNEEIKETGKDKFLQNGAFPCYNLYRLSDGNYIAMGCVEDKFWNDSDELLHFPIKASERFNTDEQTLNKMTEFFAQKASSDISSLIKDKDLCLNIVKTS